MKDIFTEIKRVFMPNSENVQYVVSTSVDMMNLMDDYALHRIPELLAEKLAQKYVEDYGGEILKRVQEKTIEQKVIQKVVSNLRKELKGENQ